MDDDDATREPTDASASPETGPAEALDLVAGQLDALSIEGSEQSAVVFQPIPLPGSLYKFPRRPGSGRVGTRCLVKANHFLAELPDKDLHQYDVR
jgi:eukaryotic translation initiation factor 2C